MNHPQTIDLGKRALFIPAEVKVSVAFDQAHQPNLPHPPYENCYAIWDTGAMRTTISPKIAQKLGLKSIGLSKMQHANGEALVNTYLINLLLPNKIEIHTLTVSEGAIPDVDALIGMDIISLCDFAITNKDGRTLFSFDIPSCREVDFTQGDC